MKLCVASFVIGSILLLVKMGKMYIKDEIHMYTISEERRTSNLNGTDPAILLWMSSSFQNANIDKLTLDMGRLEVETLAGKKIWQWSPCARALFPGKRDICSPLLLCITWGNISSVIHIWERVSSRYQINQQLDLELLPTDK